jgi:hypothetical protein
VPSLCREGGVSGWMRSRGRSYPRSVQRSNSRVRLKFHGVAHQGRRFPDPHSVCPAR